MNLIKCILERTDVNRRINYDKISWEPLVKIWEDCYSRKPVVNNIEDLLLYSKPFLATDTSQTLYLEKTLQYSVCLAAKLTTTWEVILEPACAFGKSKKAGTRTKGFCDLLIVTSPFKSSLFEFKRDKKDMRLAIEEVTGYMVIQNTNTLKILHDGREEEFWADQISFDRYAVTGGEEGLHWEFVDSEIVRNKMLKARDILFPSEKF